MKLTPSAGLAALCWTARLASAATGHVYILDPARPQSHPSGEARRLHPVAARVVLAQRAGVEDYHSADLGDDSVRDAVNEFGVRTAMFGAGDGGMRQRAMVLVEGVEDAGAQLPSLQKHTAFALDPAPAARALWRDLARQARPSTYAPLDDAETLDLLSSPQTQFGHHHDAFYIAASPTDFAALLSNPKITANYAITAYLSPPNQAHPADDSTHQSSPWGAYTLPPKSSLHTKRLAPGRPQKEAPLEPPPHRSSSEQTEGLAPSLAKTNTNTTTTPPKRLPGILPQCFPTLSLCQTLTRNCSSHGTCTKKYTDASASSSSPAKQCFTCACAPTVIERGEGRVQTTYWGGPACQKRDVSVQFWMLALFSVGLVFVIGFAVGELWTMGRQELPSVIGAGVSGPVKRG
ncbi:hypothetical protein LTR08_006564 [Meristemomyces frigidus]|nr:hypothetical protein LTR08_006564 [Meristemomyces frigidus]